MDYLLVNNVDDIFCLTWAGPSCIFVMLKSDELAPIILRQLIGSCNRIWILRVTRKLYLR